MKKFAKIIRFIIPYWTLVLINFLFNVASVIFSLFSFTMVIPFLGILFKTQPIIENSVPFEWNYDSTIHNFNYFLSQIIVNEGKQQALLIIIGLVVITTFLKTGFWFAAKYFLAPVRNYVIRDIRNKLYNKVLDLPLSYFSEERKGDIISRMTGDVQEIEISVIHSINVLLKEPITIIIYLFSLLILSPHLTIFVFILLPISGFIIGRIGRNLRKQSLAGQQRLGDLLSLIEETLSGLRIVKAFNSEEKMSLRFQKLNQYYTKIMVKMWRRSDLATPLSEFLGTVVIVIVMWYGGMLVLENNPSLSSEALIGYLVIFSQIINPAKAFSTAYYTIQKGLASAERIDGVLDAEVKIMEKIDAKNVSVFDEKIVFENVSFKYLDDYVLQNVNLTIKKGTTVALVGQSGSGKSTMVDLLPRFYDVTEGDIKIDGTSTKDLKIKDLRGLMGNVNQESILFNDTIFNNISFGVENADKESVEKAAKVANAYSFILETPDGFDTNIGDRGGKLSGGQRQRLSIARAVLKNPPILILDEATSALDTESERVVQDALTNLMKNRTSIVIAHRLSTILHADEICVLHEGRIVERGTHVELLKLQGTYKKLHDLQMFS